MKIKDIIEKLQSYDPETNVVVKVCEGEYRGRYEYTTDIKEIRINTDPWYYGEHEKDDDGNETVSSLT